MSKSWRALPVGDTGAQLKAPTYQDYKEQVREGWKAPRDVAQEAAFAAELMTILDAEEMRIPLGKQYTLWRYPQGLAVGLPSGWTVYMDLESQVRQPGISQKMREAAKAKGEAPDEEA